MIDRVLIDTLNIKSGEFAIKWKDKLRAAHQLKHYHKLEDSAIHASGIPLFKQLSVVLDRGLDNDRIGLFFMEKGKERLSGGFPVSEVVYGLNLAQKVVIEYIMTEFAPQNSIRMYQSLGALTTISEFFLLGSLYIIKGFIHETYSNMSKKDKEHLEMFRQYFRDDFFFVKEKK